MKCCCLSHNGFLTTAGYAVVAQRERQLYGGVDLFEDLCYVDRVVSVSALVEVEGAALFDDQLIDQQHRRFLNGS